MGSIGCVHTGGGCAYRRCGTGAQSAASTTEAAYRNVIDPCYPDRYGFAARQAVIAPFAQQVNNGYVLNQTLWNYYFEAGSDKLTPAGLEKLDSLVRSQPTDSKLYIQTARDLASNIPLEKVPDARAELDAKRAVAIQKYLAARTGLRWRGGVRRLGPRREGPGIVAEQAAGAYRASFQGYRGGITGAANIGAARHRRLDEPDRRSGHQQQRRPRPQARGKPARNHDTT